MADKINIAAPALEGQTISFTISGTHNGVPYENTVNIVEYGFEQQEVPVEQTLTAFGGRINVYNQPMTNPSAGKMTPRPGGGTTLNLLGVDDAQTITATGPGGAQISIEVAQTSSKSGWAPAEYYMPERNPTTGDLVVKPGRNFWGVIYATASANVYDAAKIAAEVTAGGTTLTAAQVTGTWLRNQSVYGRSQAKAITASLAVALVNAIPKTAKTTAGAWISLERGYEYPVNIMPMYGETPLHPFVITAWGTGTDPKGFRVGGTGSYVPQNIAVIGAAARFSDHRNFENLLLADGTYSGDGRRYAIEFSAEPLSSGLTVYRPKILDARKDPENKVGGSWTDHDNRQSGIYPSGIKGVLIELAALDRNGWAEGFLYDILQSVYDPPDLLSHNGYIQYTNMDVTVADCLSLDPASAHFQIRPGGWLLGFVGVNGGFLSNLGQPRVGGENPDQQGWFGYNERAVITSGTPRRVSDLQGAVRRGFDFGGPQMSTVDCLVIHVADPDSPTEWADKAADARDVPRAAYWKPEHPPQYKGLTHYKWEATNVGIEGLDTALLDVTSIQRYAASVTEITGDPIRDYANYVRSLSPQDQQEEILSIQDFFLTPLKPKSVLPLDKRTTPADIFATPSELTEGFRTDIGLNFSTNDVPGTHPADTLDLMGNDYKHVRLTSNYAAVKFSGGSFTVSSGKLAPGAHLDAAKVIVGPHAATSGKYYAPNTTGDYEARGGLLVFTGTANIGLKASGNSEVVLGRACTIPAGKTLRLSGDMGWCGWDHLSGTATLDIEGTLEFEVTPVFEFAAKQMTPWWLQMGRFVGGTSGATGTPDAWRKVGEADRVRFRDVVGTPTAGETSVDGLVIKSVGPVRQAPVLSNVVGAEIGRLQRFRSGEHDTFDAGTGQWVLNEPGVTATVNLKGPVNILNKTWLQQFNPAGTVFSLGGGAGTGVTYVDSGATLQSGLSIVSGELRLTL